MELDSHKSLMMSINVIGGHLTEHSCNEAKSEETTKRMERLNDDWDKACDRATQWQTTLQTALMQVKRHYCFIVHYFHSKTKKDHLLVVILSIINFIKNNIHFLTTLFRHILITGKNNHLK
jgi:hypothetical protein